MACARCGADEGDGHRCAGAVHPVSSAQDLGSPALVLDDSEYRQLTVMFCDVVGSTALSERLDAEQLRDVLREYQRRSAAVIRNHRGYVAQFLGDGIMAYFGYPTADAQASVAAVEAGLSLVAPVRHMQRDAEKLEIRVGIHSGWVVIGEMGDPSQPQRLAVGNVPNVAARAQAEAEADSVVITNATLRLVEGYFDCEPVGTRQLRGVSGPVRLYRVQSRSPISTRMQVAERRGLSRFVGRDHCLRLLVEGYGQARASRGALVIGEPGIGKSRLVYEFCRSIPAHRLVDCSAVEHRESDALFPILRFLSSWVEQQSSKGGVAESLDAIGLSKSAPQLVSLMTPERESLLLGSLPTAKQYQRTIDILCDFICALAEREPCVVLVEDAHWLDPSTRIFVQALTERRQPGAFVLLTSRTDLDRHWAEATGLSVIDLEPLGEEASRSLATDIAEQTEAPLSRSTIDQLVARGEGVPLFIEESARARIESAAMPPRVAPTSEHPGIPETLRDSLAARLDGLGNARRIAQLASVVGRSFPLQWLARLIAPDFDAGEAALVPLLDAGLVRKATDASNSYEFSHALIRDAAYHSLTRGARVSCHRRLVDVIIAEHPDLATRQPLVVAHHAEAAGDHLLAATYLLRAARRALASSAFVEAMDIVHQGLAELTRLSAPSLTEPVEVELLSTQGLALISTRGYSSLEVEEVYARAWQLCQGRGDAPLHVLYGLWSTAFIRSDTERIPKLVEQFQRCLEKVETPEEAFVVNSCLGVHACFSGKLAPARDYFDAAIATLDLDDLPAQQERLLARHGYDGVFAAFVFRTWVEAIEGHVASARRGMERTWQLAEKLGDASSACYVSGNFSMLARDLNDVDGARFYAGRAVSLSTEHGLYFWQAIALCAQGWVLTRDGSPAEGLVMVENGSSLLDAIGALMNRGVHRSCLAEALIENGRLEDALSAAEEGLAMTRFEPMVRAYLVRLKASIQARMDRGAEAESNYRDALRLMEGLGMRTLAVQTMADLGMLLSYLGRREEGEALLRRARVEWPEGLGPSPIALPDTLANIASA